MLVQYRQAHLLDRSAVFGRRAGVVHDPVGGGFALGAGRADEYHYVIRVLLDPGLVEEEQVSGPALRSITGYENRVVILKGLAVGKLGKLSVRHVALLEGPEISAEQLFAQGAILESVCAHVGGDSLILRTHALKPGPVVSPEGLAHAEADKAGAIALLRVPRGAILIELHLGDASEPATEAFSVVIGPQLGRVGNSVPVRIAPGIDDGFDPLGVGRGFVAA